MKWKIPPRIKVYEALGAIGDERIKINNNTALVTSSSGNKEYEVQYDPEGKAITANDNGSYWQGYLGYPSIAFLIEKGIITCDKGIAALLKGIAWKDINQKHGNDFDRVEGYIKSLMKEQDIRRVDAETKNIMMQINKLNLKRLKSEGKPPKGY